MHAAFCVLHLCNEWQISLRSWRFCWRSMEMKMKAAPFPIPLAASPRPTKQPATQANVGYNTHRRDVKVNSQLF